MFATDVFKDRVALVTGGAGGIGHAVVKALAAHGAQVVAADKNLAETGGLAAVHPVRLDVTKSGEIAACVNQILKQFGRLDILVNVAGVVSLGNSGQVTEAEWDRVMDINLKGTFLCCQAVIPAMKQAGFGRIVNMGSVLGKNGGNPRPWIDPSEQERASNVAYGVSKAGVQAVTTWLAKELASAGITVNSVAPGPVASAMTRQFPESLRALIPVGRMGEADEIAAAVLFLASPQSAFITGETLDVNGGIWPD